jgi:integrase
LRTHWEDVNIPNRELGLNTRRTGKSDLPLSMNWRSKFLRRWALDSQETRSSLPNVTPAQVTVAFIRACGDAGVADFSLHDLRHTFASHARMVSDGTIIKEINCLKRLFSIAVSKEEISNTPAHGADVPEAPQGRVRYLTKDR